LVITIATFLSGQFTARHVSALQRESSDPVEALAATKKGTITASGPKTFYYLDETDTDDMYAQIAGAARLKNLEVEGKRGRNAAGKINTTIAEFGAGASSGFTMRSQYEVSQKLALRYQIVERQLIDSGSATFGLEDFEPDETAVKRMAELLETRDSNPDRAELEAMQRRLQALNRAAVISKAIGYEAISADFEVVASWLNRNLRWITR
jgi:hypothetical protein